MNPRDHPSEGVERAALADLHLAATPEITERLGLQCIASNSMLISVAGELPNSAIVINRCLGPGLLGPATAATVQQISQIYANAGVGRFFLQRHPAAKPAALMKWLSTAGLVRARLAKVRSRDSAAIRR